MQSLPAENLTNGEIATRFSVFARVVESLHASLARNLGAETRVEVARSAAEAAVGR